MRLLQGKQPMTTSRAVGDDDERQWSSGHNAAVKEEPAAEEETNLKEEVGEPPQEPGLAESDTSEEHENSGKVSWFSGFRRRKTSKRTDEAARGCDRDAVTSERRHNTVSARKFSWCATSSGNYRGRARAQCDAACGSKRLFRFWPRPLRRYRGNVRRWRRKPGAG